MKQVGPVEARQIRLAVARLETHRRQAEAHQHHHPVIRRRLAEARQHRHLETRRRLAAAHSFIENETALLCMI